MKKISILTTTFYKNREEIRFHLAAQLIGNAIAQGYEVVVVDGSPDPSIAEAFVKIGAQVFKQTAQGMGGSRRELFKIATANATKDSVFVWTEPEKVDLIRLIPEIISPIVKGEADIVIPARTEKSWDSYPAFQVLSEKKANTEYLKETKESLDLIFGPVAFGGMVADHFYGCDPTIFGATDGYIQHFAVMWAMATGYKVASVPVDFYYPSIQKEEEDGALKEEMLKKRQWQLDQLVAGYTATANFLGLGKG